MDLTPKQALFVAEYLKDLSAAGAYRRAGYKVKSDNVAAVEGHKLLRNPKVALAVQAAKDQRAQRTEITTDRVLRELAALAFSDLRRVASWDGETVKTKNSEAISPDDAACVSEVSASKHGVKIKLHSKPDAMRMLMMHLGLLKDRVEHTGKDGGAIQHEHTGTLTDEQRLAGLDAILARVGAGGVGPAARPPSDLAGPDPGGPVAGDAPGRGEA